MHVDVIDVAERSGSAHLRATAYLENHANREVVGGGTTESNKTVEDNIEDLAQQVSQLVTIYVTSLEAMKDLQVEEKEKQALDDRRAGRRVLTRRPSSA